jgi:hypothetical protein
MNKKHFLCFAKKEKEMRIKYGKYDPCCI